MTLMIYMAHVTHERLEDNISNSKLADFFVFPACFKVKADLRNMTCLKLGLKQGL